MKETAARLLFDGVGFLYHVAAALKAGDGRNGCRFVFL